MHTFSLKIAFAFLAFTLLFSACKKDKEDNQDTLQRNELHGKWAVTNMEGKLFVKVSNIPETEAPLMTFWKGKVFYFQENNNLSVLENQKELFDFGAYTLNGSQLTVANYPGVLHVAFSGSSTLKLTNKQDDYYKMLSFYTGQPESEIKQMYRVEGDIVFHLTKQ